MIGRGQLALGLAVFIAAKLLGTALFARLYVCVLGVRDTVHHWLRRQRAYRLARLALRRLRRYLPRRGPRGANS